MSQVKEQLSQSTKFKKNSLFEPFLSQSASLKNRLSFFSLEFDQKSENNMFSKNCQQREQKVNLVDENKPAELESQSFQCISRKTSSANFREFKVELKNFLMRMSYRQKLDHVQALVHEARSLALKYGFFYITCAMIIFNPESQVKLSIWIHPDTNKKYPLHPMKKRHFDSQKQFYSTLKKVILQLFPTVSLMCSSTYESLMKEVHEHKNELNFRLKQKKFQFKKQSEHILESNQQKQQKKKFCPSSKEKTPSTIVSSNTYSPFSTIQSNSYQPLVYELQKEVQNLFSNQNSIFVPEESFRKLEEELNNIL